MKAGYPQKMVKEITTKVLNSERDISVKKTSKNLRATEKLE